MKKELLFCLSFILLVACNSNNTTTSTSKEQTETTSSSETISSTSSLSLSIEVITSSQESSSLVDEQTPKDRHDFYLEYSKVSKDVAIPIQGKLIGYEQYPYSPNCNAWFQEGKYGYYVINLPLQDVELGKSYYVYGLSLERDYYGINAKTDYYYCVEEVNGFEIETINLNEETPVNDDYIGSKVSLNGVVKTINDNVFIVEINNETYSVSYNKSVNGASEIASVYSSISVGSNVFLEGILHATNREIRIINASELIIN